MPDTMVEGQQPTPVPATRTRAPRGAAPVEPVQAEPQLLDYDTLIGQLNQHLSKDDPDYAAKIGKLRSHPVVGGIAGNIAEQMKRVESQAAQVEAAAAAAKAKEQELMDLAENDPEEFAARFRTQAQAEAARRELEALRSAEQTRIAGHIGLAVRDLPELQTLSVAEQRKIADALAGVPADKVLGVYTQTVIDIAADKRGAARMERELPARIQAEVEARRVESNAARVRTAAAPDLRMGAAGPTSDAPDSRSDPAGYVRWLEDQRRNRR